MAVIGWIVVGIGVAFILFLTWCCCVAAGRADQKFEQDEYLENQNYKEDRD